MYKKSYVETNYSKAVKYNNNNNWKNEFKTRKKNILFLVNVWKYKTHCIKIYWSLKRKLIYLIKEQNYSTWFAIKMVSMICWFCKYIILAFCKFTRVIYLVNKFYIMKGFDNIIWIIKINYNILCKINTKHLKNEKMHHMLVCSVK